MNSRSNEGSSSLSFSFASDNFFVYLFCGSGLRLRVEGQGFEVWGAGFGVEKYGFRV